MAKYTFEPFLVPVRLARPGKCATEHAVSAARAWPRTAPGERSVSRTCKTPLADDAPDGTSVLRFHLVD